MLWRLQTLSNKQDAKTKVRGLLVMMIFQAIFISQTMGPWIGKFVIYFSCFRHRKDWVCRIDVRRTFGISPNKVSVSKLDSAVETAMEYLRRDPLQQVRQMIVNYWSSSLLDLIFQVELFFRAGNYKIDTGERATFTLKHIRPLNNGHLAIVGQGNNHVQCSPWSMI